MNQIETLTLQTQDAYQWITKLLASVPYEKWHLTPKTLDTNLTWQCGHLILSYYYHSIMVTVGHQKSILAKVPVQEYSKSFKHLTTPSQGGTEDLSARLKEHLDFMSEKSIETIRQLPETALSQPLEPTEYPHPVAKTKFEALDWNIKHTMWHCGQIALIKRVVSERHDFGV